MVNSRRGRIIDLLSQGFSDSRIINIIDSEFPLGTFSTSNEKALYGTKWDIGKTNRKKTIKNNNPITKLKNNSNSFNEYDLTQLIDKLRHFNVVPVIEHYRNKDLAGKTPEEILSFSVDNTIYRAFRYETPSQRYSNWRWHKSPNKLVDILNNLQNQKEFDVFAYEVGNSLVSDWGATNERGEPTRMNIGVSMKITNLVLKHLSFSSNVTNSSLIEWLHVPWDSFTLKPLRVISTERHLYPPIPASPTQGFVNNIKLYQNLHLLISEISNSAGKPRIYYEFYTWDNRHQI